MIICLVTNNDYVCSVTINDYVCCVMMKFYSNVYEKHDLLLATSSLVLTGG